MKMIIIAVLVCILPTSLCWEYPGYPGVDCPKARERMLAENDSQWMIPKCNEDGSYAELQCYEKYPDTCMCVAPDGSALTLPGFGLGVKTCICFLAQYHIHEHNPDAVMPRCARDGSYAPLQCNQATGECWCVDKNGKITVSASKNVQFCPI